MYGLRSIRFAAAFATCAALVPGPSLAGDAPGRYTMSPAEGGGFVRLDTQTGQMSLCNRRDGQWSCLEMAEPARGLSDEVERLRAENRELRAELGRPESATPGAPAPESHAGRPSRRLELPSEQDVDNAMSYVQRMLRKFREKLKEFETDSKGTPL